MNEQCEDGLDPLSIRSYHAHVYFEGDVERRCAEVLRERIAERFSVELGRWHATPVAPHTRAMYQVAFAESLFGRFVPWLMLHRASLAILVHPNTGRPRDDHLRHALWLGAVLELRADVLPLVSALDDRDAVVPNTVPGPAPIAIRPADAAVPETPIPPA